MKKVILIVIGVLIIGCLCLGIFYFKDNNNLQEKDNSVNEIKKNYSQYVKLAEDDKIYTLNDGNYVEIGTFSKGNEFELSDTKITSETKYFNIKDTEYYVSYKNLEKIDSLTIYSDRFLNYVPFNQNVVTIDNFTMTDEFNNTISFNESMSLPIYIKDTDSYGVNYNNRLYTINADQVKEIVDNQNSDAKIKDKIGTLTYHFIYDPETQECTQAICQTLDQFESHLKYLTENNYLTLKLNELEMFLDGKIQVPYNSCVLTIDDGTVFNSKAIELLEKYKQHATLFVITGWVENLDRLKSDYLDLESHSDHMHNQYECNMGLQGGAILCKSEEYIINDLKTSQEKLGGSTYFAYPFFDVNDHAIECLKKAGFTMAFIGQGSTVGRSWPGTNKYKVPRRTIFSSTTMEQFVSYID